MRLRLRVFVVLSLIGLRLALGYLISLAYEQFSVIRVRGNIYRIYRNENKCIIELGRFLIDFRSCDLFSQGDRVEVIGRVNARVTSRLMGKIELDTDEIEVIADEISKPGLGNKIIVWSGTVREKMSLVYKEYLPEPESSLVAGIVLGDKSDIGRDFYQRMIKSGTVHIAVASGFNVMLVGSALLSVGFWFLKRGWASVMAVGGMVFYGLISGWGAPVVRAVVFSGLIYASFVLGRRRVGWWLLLLTGGVMILADPMILASVSFQLSIAASVGLVGVEPWARKMWQKRGLGGDAFVWESGLGTTLCTMLTTAPILWWHFSKMSYIGILSNILILPFVPLLMILSSLMLVAPFVFGGAVFALAGWIAKVIVFFSW